MKYSMERFIDIWDKHVISNPDKEALLDIENALTYKELDVLSGRVYAYLKEKGIGKEDMVMISLPHGVQPYVAMLGVWKAGAALVMSSDKVPAEREEFIRKDCNCVLTIDSEAWKEILNKESLPGHEETSPNDACFAVYTSGSEGKPKGVLHEYGKLEYNSFFRTKDTYQSLPLDSRECVPFPANTAGALLTVMWWLWHGMTIDVGPLYLMADCVRLNDYLTAHRDTVVSMPASLYKPGMITSPTIKFILLGLDTAYDVYDKNVVVMNVYAQTEGFLLCTFEVDRPYSVSPIGKAVDEYEICLLEDDGKEVPKGMMGELCYRNPYTRGYINHPEMTAQMQVNGLWRSGDIARVNEDGNIVILGRKSSMIKINGNRIEPGEIEEAVKKVLGIDWAYAKGFVTPQRSFICVYYTAELSIDYSDLREKLMKVLSPHMIPSYLVHIDQIPYMANGKVDRNAFQAPDISTLFAPYVAPTNELEQRICSAMEKVLMLDRIGINDDFFLLGGDSLLTIRLITTLDIDKLNTFDIYAARTPARIAERWMMNQLV